MTFWQRIRRLVSGEPAQQSSSTNKHEYMSLHGKSVLDVNKALETIYRKGVEHGQQMQPPLYGTSCPEHHLPLQETDPGHFICFLDHAPHAPQQTQPLQQLPLGARARHQRLSSLQQTQPLPAVLPDRERSR
jgi:hypothetical protein